MAHTVIVVDNDAANCRSIRRILELTGYMVDVATDPISAYWLWSRAKHDVVVSDFNMPGIDGITLARMMQAMLREKHQHIILMSAGPRPSDWEESEPFLRKPFTAEQLLRCITRLLGGTPSTPPRPMSAPPSAPPAP